MSGGTCECCFRDGETRRVGKWLLCDSCAAYEERWQSFTREEREEELRLMLVHSMEQEGL